jgi:hypothetical protein
MMSKAGSAAVQQQLIPSHACAGLLFLKTVHLLCCFVAAGAAAA